MKKHINSNYGWRTIGEETRIYTIFNRRHKGCLHSDGKEDITGATSSYVFTDLITKLGIKPVSRQQRCIEQMYGTMKKTVEVYNITIKSSVIEGFQLKVDCINTENNVLTHVQNPKITKIKNQNPRIRGLCFLEERETQDLLFIHIMLGIADYQRIQTNEPLVLGMNTNMDPVAEFTKLGWTLCGGVTRKIQFEKQYFVNDEKSEFQKLCSLDVLGLEDVIQPEEFSHPTFKDHIKYCEKGYYETVLPWKLDHSPFPSNKQLTKAQLLATTNRLEKIGKLDQYHKVMLDQINTGILEPILETDQLSGNQVNYILHHAVFKENAETTKLRIVNDCSSKESNDVPSLNDVPQVAFLYQSVRIR